MVIKMKIDDLRRRFKPKNVDERIRDATHKVAIRIDEGISDSVVSRSTFVGFKNPIVNRGKRNKFINNTVYA
jgi:hypothetical protein